MTKNFTKAEDEICKLYDYDNLKCFLNHPCLS